MESQIIHYLLTSGKSVDYVILAIVVAVLLNITKNLVGLISTSRPSPEEESVKLLTLAVNEMKNHSRRLTAIYESMDRRLDALERRAEENAILHANPGKVCPIRQDVIRDHIYGAADKIIAEVKSKG